MENYVEAIKQAILIFPGVAFIFTLPYIVFNYRKYGSVLGLRILIIYSFILYLICIYFLVILPLPSKEEAANISGIKLQMCPFMFVLDIVKESSFMLSNPKSWWSLVNNRALFQVIFNVVMMIPFGMYLKYYFRVRLKKTIIISFLVSLFFELTQLTGLYFIYSGSYRVFDVDDLIANTLGGTCGYLAVEPLERFLPSRDEIDNCSFERGKVVSLLRRIVALSCDLLLAGLIDVLLAAIFPYINSSFQVPLLWCCYILIHILYKGKTPGKRIARIKLASIDNKRDIHWYQYIIRYGSLIVIFYLLPVILLNSVDYLSECCGLHPTVEMVLNGIIIGGYVFGMLYELIMLIMHKLLFYERLSGTQNISTINK